MTNFQLEQKSTGKVLTNFRVVDSAGACYGSVNIPNGAVRDFVAHWKGAPVAKAAKQQTSAAAALSKAFQRSKQPRLSKQAILRGS